MLSAGHSAKTELTDTQRRPVIFACLIKDGTKFENHWT